MDPAKRSVRREILRVLRTAGSIGTNSEVVLQYLVDQGFGVTLPEVESHLAYLAGRGKEYCELQTLEVEGFPRRLKCTLTPRGMDLLERNIPADPGVA